MKEQLIQSKLISELEKLGAYVVKVIAASRKGVPDLLVCHKGRFIGIEVKHEASKNRVTPLQALNLQRISKAGGASFVVYNEETINHVVRMLKGENDGLVCKL